MDPDEAIINSCRVCRVPNQEGEFEVLYYEETGMLTAAGQLYEELIGVVIETATANFYPQYLCNSCDLQMKLFKKIKTKANKTLQELKEHYKIEQKENMLENHKEKDIDILLIIDKQDTQTLETDTNGNDEDEPEQQLMKIESDYQQNDQCISEELTADLQIQYENENNENIHIGFIELIDDDCKLDVESLEYLDDTENELIDNEPPPNNKQTSKKLDYNANPKVDLGNEENNGSSSDFIADEFEEFLSIGEKSSDIDKFDTRSEFAEILDDTSQNTTTATANDDENIYFDVHYLDLREFEKDCKKKNYFCHTCNILFSKRVEYQKHKKQVHLSKFPCPDCAKVFQTADSLRVHLNLHRGLPPYQCDLCSKTFNQKVHLNYHIAKHNNVRNFKCEVCEKGFLAKGDLAIHMRCHTNERRYSCDICNKEFLMHEHMKNHRFSHFDKKFECKICKQKFVSPSTLRTHTKSIHEDEPRFQCEYCIKKFRRKHHLEAHYKVHRKQIAVAIEEYEEGVLNGDEDLIITEDVILEEKIQEDIAV